MHRCRCLAVAGAAAFALISCGRLPAPNDPTVIEETASAPVGPRDLAPILARDDAIRPFLAEAARRRIEVLVAVPKDDGALERYAFRSDAEYFYPASAVKLAAAVAAVEKLEELRAQRRDLALSTPLRITFAGDRARVVDTTLSDEIERALVVSDNEAYNRLFDFVGREELAARLAKYGLENTRLTHHLGADDRDRVDPAFELLGAGPSIFVPQRVGVEAAATDRALVGTAYVDDDGKLVAAPLDFGQKNRMPLQELQDLLVTVVRPELSSLTVPDWSEGDRKSLVQILGRVPSDLGGSALQALDDRHKPLLRAVSAELPEHVVRVYGKGGRAYGFTVENSWIVDETAKRSVFVAATIYANDNETINDDRYEYEAVADPFIASLGGFVARSFLR